MNNFKEDDKQSIVEQGDAGEIINYEENKVEPVKDSTDFFTVNNCINTYLNTINQNNSAYYGMNEKNEYVKIVTDARNKSEYI